MAKSESQKKREQDKRGKEKTHHWLIAYHPWYRNHSRHSSIFSQNDLQDIGWFMAMILDCPWTFVQIVQYQTSKDYIIVKVNLSVEITSKLGQYNWIDFLKQQRSGHDHENTKVFEYNFMELGDQNRRQWKEYFPLNRAPPVDFPIDITHNFSAPKWCDRPNRESVKWTIPIPEPLDFAPGSHSRNTTREASISENNSPVEQQSPSSTIDGRYSVKLESKLNVAIKADGGHDPKDLQQHGLRISLDAPIYASSHASLFTADDAPSAPQPQPAASRFHPYRPLLHNYPSLDSNLDSSLNGTESNVSPKREHLKSDVSGLRISNCNDTPAIPSGLKNQPAIDLCYPDDDEEQEAPNHWIIIKNPYGIRWKGTSLPEFVEIWDWLQLFADGALELYADLSQRNVIVCLSGSVDLNGILGRHVWKDMLKDPSHLIDADRFSLIVPCLMKDLDGLVKIHVPEPKEDYSIFVEPYPLPLPFMGEFEEDKKQINVKTEGTGLIQALKTETASENASRQEGKRKVEGSDENENKRVKLEDAR